LNLGNASFDAPQTWDVDVRGAAEAPFIAVGPGGGVLGHPDPAATDAAVYTLVVGAK
jgi:hypothetical protein